MNLPSLHGTSPKLKKHHVALALALLASLSYVYSVTFDYQTPTQADIAGITPAIAAAIANTDLEIFVKFDNIAGDVTDVSHRGEVQADSFAWDTTRAITATKPTMGGFKVTMPASGASPKMFLYSAGGVKIPTVKLTVRRKGTTADFLTWTLWQAQIVEYKTVGNTRGDGVSDQVTFSFAKITNEYRPILPNGSLGTAVSAGWDQRTNASSN